MRHCVQLLGDGAIELVPGIQADKTCLTLPPGSMEKLTEPSKAENPDYKPCQNPRIIATHIRQYAATIHRKPCPYPDYRGLPRDLFEPPRRTAPCEGQDKDRKPKPMNGEFFYTRAELVEIVSELHHANNRMAAQPVKAFAQMARSGGKKTPPNVKKPETGKVATEDIQSFILKFERHRNRKKQFSN